MPDATQVLRETVEQQTPRRRWRTWLRRAIAPLVGDYQIFRIYRFELAGFDGGDLSPWRARGYEFREVTAADIAASDDEQLRSRAFYSGDDAFTFAILRDGRIVCAQWLWYGERYRTRRGFWPLRDDEAKSIELFTVAECRGEGLATALKLYSAEILKAKGFATLYSRIWFSHEASCRVSEKAGWRNVAIVAEINPFRLRWTVRFVHRISR